MTRYLRIRALCFSLAVIVSLLGFTSAFAESNHNSTRSNTAKPQKSERQIQPIPKPVEATTVQSSEDSGGDRKRGTASQKPAKCGIIRDDSGDTSRRAKGDETTCGGFCEGLGEICIQDMANGPCYCKPGE